MAKPRNDTKETIIVKNITYKFYKYAKNMNDAMEKTQKTLNKAQFINTGFNQEIAIYLST